VNDDIVAQSCNGVCDVVCERIEVVDQEHGPFGFHRTVIDSD